NRGTLRAETPGSILYAACTLTNQGFVHASNGGSIKLTGLMNSGSISADGGTIMLAGVPAAIGSLQVRNGGLAIWAQSPTTSAVRSLDVADSVISVQEFGSIQNVGATIHVHDDTNRWQLRGGSI